MHGHPHVTRHPHGTKKSYARKPAGDQRNNLIKACSAGSLRELVPRTFREQNGKIEIKHVIRETKNVIRGSVPRTSFSIGVTFREVVFRGDHPRIFRLDDFLIR